MRFSKATILAFIAFSWIGLLSTRAFAQEVLPRLGVGAKVSTLGIGFEAATAVTDRSNVRGGFNFFNYDRTARRDGIHYDAALTLRSVQVTYDHYILPGFHVSPGLLLHNGNSARATASVAAGQSFSLGDVRYFSNSTNPVNGTANVKLRTVTPLLLVGFGNLLPRNNRHFGVNGDFGIAFQGSPESKLSLAGTACAVSPTAACINAATDPIVQANIQREQNEMNHDLRPFKYYPIISLGVSWKF